MVTLPELWLPILLSAIFVFVASFLLWVALPFHRSDWQKIPGEEPLLEAIRGLGLSPGQYFFPGVEGPEAREDPEKAARLERGPVGFLILTKGAPSMAKNLALWFVLNLAVAFMVAYVAGRTLGPGTEYLQVFRVTATITILSYGTAEIVQGIFFGRTWSTVWKSVLDAVVYGLLTGGAFGWLWPG